MEDWRIFVKVSERGSFAAAARDLSMSPAGVTRSIKALEERLGVRLFTRTTRTCRLTRDGERFLVKAGPILEMIDEAEDEARQAGAGLVGLLRISAPISFGRRRVAPLIDTFRKQNPGLAIDLSLTDSSNDLAMREVDLALRVGAPTGGDFITRRVLRARRVICAAPEYLATHGQPRVPADLLEHRNLVIVRDGKPVDHWMFEEDGKMQTMRIPYVLSSNSGEIVEQWALDGHGIALKSLWDIESLIERGELVEVLARHCAENADMFLVYPDRRNLPARVRAFIDFLIAELSHFGDRLAPEDRNSLFQNKQ